MPSFDVSGLVPTTIEVSRLIRSTNGSDAFRQSKDINGRLLADIRKYEAGLESESVMSAWVIPRMETILIGMLGAGNEKVYRGRNGWLYYRPDLDVLTGPGFLEPRVLQRRRQSGNEIRQAPQPDPVLGIKTFRDQLRRRGIELLVVPTPNKAMIYPGEFARGAAVPVPLYNASDVEFKRRLTREGIAYLDLAPAMVAAKGSRPLFLKTDTHWSPDGCELVARELARFIQSRDLLTPVVSAGYVRGSMGVEQQGDLCAMLKMARWEQFYPAERVTNHPVSDAAGRPWGPSSSADVLLLGDSYCNIYSLDGMGWGTGAGLAEQLSFVLQRPLDTVLINDNGAYASRRQLSRLLLQDRKRLNGKKLVIWEFAARELVSGDWKLDLELPTDGPDTFDATAVSHGPMQISGVLRKAASAPRPRTVPYKDCIVALHLVDVRSTDPRAVVDTNVVVYVWGMRDNQLEPAAGWLPGQRLSLKVVPWGDVEPQMGKYNRAELDDAGLTMLKDYWVVDDSKLPAVTSLASGASSKELPNPAPAEPMKRNGVSSPVPDVVPAGNTFMKELAARADELAAENRSVLRGNDGWLFYGPELRSLSVGRFWGTNAVRVSRCSNPANADPLAAILDFDAQVKSVGAELLLVPIPGKAAVYPDKIADFSMVRSGAKQDRVDGTLREFYEQLRRSGVTVLDLTDEMIAHRDDAGGAMFCRQDTHFSPRAVAWVAAQIRAAVTNRPWLDTRPGRRYNLQEKEITLNGDLWGLLGDPSLAKEKVTVQVVTGPDAAPVGTSRDSPVLLMGDSHTLIYSAGEDLQATGAGLPEHLAAAFGFPVDLIGIRGSGATPARVSLLRRRDNLAGKKLIVWCFTVREFTESTVGWAKVPVVRP